MTGNEMELGEGKKIPFSRIIIGILFSSLIVSCATEFPIALDKIQPMTPTEARSFLTKFPTAVPESFDYGSFSAHKIIEIRSSFSMVDVLGAAYQKYPTAETKIPLLDMTNPNCQGEDAQNGIVEGYGHLYCRYGNQQHIYVTWLQTTPGTPGRLLSAINALALETQRFFSKKEEEKFQQTLQEYKSNANQPIVPKEELDKLLVQAQDAVNDKDFIGAADLYLQAGELAPLLPSAHFNAALLLGDTGDYLFAIREMKRYLALAPQAPNAHVVQDQIYRWERKLQQ